VPADRGGDVVVGLVLDRDRRRRDGGCRAEGRDEGAMARNRLVE
jgi:hypothetical protein